MQYREAFKIAIRALKINKGRSLLTILGIVIGIAAVLVVMSAGNSIQNFVFAEMDSFGSDIVQTEIKIPSTKHTSSENATSMVQGVVITSLKLADQDAILKLPNIKKSYAAFLGQEVLSWDDKVKSSMVMAASASLAEIDSSKVDTGRFFTKEEDDSLARVVVLGSKMKEKLFGQSDAIGQNIKIRKTNFKVVGTVKSNGGSFFIDRDQMVYIPIQTAQKLLWGIDHVSFIASEMKDPSKDEETVADINELLRERHNITDPDKDDFAVTSMDDAKDMLGTILGGVELLLIALAGISLVVGGVGIMNIMYVSVSERTFEIGLRKAVGASGSDILWQFLWEAVVVTFLGAVVGMMLGIELSHLITLIAASQNFAWEFIIVPSSLVLSSLVAIAIGLVFGIFPARWAARIDPVTALRANR